MLLTVFLFVTMDVIGKTLTQHYPVFQVTWARFFFHALWLLLFLRRRFVPILSTRRPRLQLLRGLLMLSANTLFVAAISVMPLVSVNSILLLSPLFVTALSLPLLGERVGPRRWACVAAGALGALIVIRPGGGGELARLAALLPLGAACCFALYQIATRRLSQEDPPLTTLFYTISIGVPVTTLIMPWVWVAPSALHWLMMATMGLIGVTSHFTLIKAFSAAPAAVVSPFNYTNLLWAALYGFVIFDELPDRWTLIGAAVIIGSGLYAFWREQRSARRPDG